MRYFSAPSELLNSMRSQVMVTLGQPNESASQPWGANITSLALCPHEYEPPQYAALIEYALENGATEITAEQYAELQPKSDPMLSVADHALAEEYLNNKYGL